MEQNLKADDKPVRTIPPYPAGLQEGEDPAAAMERHNRDDLEWRFAGLGDWSDEEIFKTLGGLGIAADPERFRAEALRYRSVEDLADAWGADIGKDDLWLDFPYFAARELWFRFAADIPAPEVIGEELEECDDLLLEGEPDMAEVKSTITRFLDFLQEVSPEAMPERLARIQSNCLADVGYVCSDVITVLEAGDLDLARRIVDVYSLAVPDGEPPLFGALALVLARAGRIEEAGEYLDRQIAAAPEALDTYRTAFDVAAELKDGDAMVRYAVEALNREDDLARWDDLNEEVRRRFAERGEMDRYQSVVKQAARPPEPVMLDRTPPPPIRIIEPARSASVIGRNDPCPCGSGKKYKKCCGR